ncbi:hypothetical protein ACIRSS_21750 [Amycolatopsis sp. NPDC101161]|uniref:hypothetical protein n=1 Tax=Amycolatopsis sp. NPDC101161 TaxID=3363940 RepID=UPI00380AF6AA
MDAALAGLIGAAVGMSGAVLSSVITTGRAQRLRREDRREEAYARGVRAVSELLYVEHEQRSTKDLLVAWTHISLVGSVEAVEHFRNVTAEFQKWVADSEYEVDFTSWAKFQNCARRDVGTMPRRRWRLRRKKRPTDAALTNTNP